MTGEDAAVLARLRKLLAAVFDTAEEAIAPGLALHDLPHWSSLAAIVLMTGIEHEFGVRPEAAAGWGAVTVGELAARLRAAG